ncbi:MAG: hypothetical protein LUE27_11020 [Clostridia bacterium]|nr:hypothetical protein [Clostridia bacterium]
MTNRRFIWQAVKGWNREQCYEMYGSMATQATFRARSPEKNFAKAFCKAIKHRVRQLRRKRDDR